MVPHHGGGHPVRYGEAEQRRILAEVARPPDRFGSRFGLAVWCEDEAGPFQAVPHPGSSWRPHGQPATQPHEYVRGGTSKLLTLFHPATSPNPAGFAAGQVHVQPAASCTNPVLHGWLKTELTAILAALPVPTELADAAATRAAWTVWQDGLTERFTLPEQLPPLRLLLVWDNLAGHKSAEMVVWLCRHGIIPIATTADFDVLPGVAEV